jgi:hypothetical protein
MAHVGSSRRYWSLNRIGTLNSNVAPGRFGGGGGNGCARSAVAIAS